MFFTDWYNSLCKSLQRTGEIVKIEDAFTKQLTDDGRVSVLLRYDSIVKQLEVTEMYKGKNNYESETFRATGNKLYSNNSLTEALKAYTRSIMLAEKNGRAIALSYANRSAVLFALGEFALCELDIQLAFENSYPVDLQYKLYERLGKCLEKLGDFEKAKENFEACLKSLNDSKLDKNKRNEKAKSLIPLINNCTGMNSEPDHTVKNYLYVAKPPEILEQDRNEIYTSATSSFSIQSDKKRGRYGVASRDISAGEVIIVEKPFASICLPECFETHCYQCLSRFKVLHPCRGCSSIGYCSLHCEEASWNSFHRYECSYMGVLIQDDIGLGHLALKIIVKVGVESLVNFQKRARQSKDGFNEAGLYESSDYLCVYSLVGNSDLRKHADLFRRSLIAIFLMKILEKTGFLQSFESAAYIVAGHLLKQIQMLPCNAHEVSENQLTGSDLVQNELKEIGSAAYATLSLLNHSCDPSVVRHCYGDVCVLRALKNIKKGAEIVDNYGFLYPVQEREERRKHLLDQYYFTCQCLPCVDDWPLYNKLYGKNLQFICDHCASPPIISSSGVCGECGMEDKEVALFDRNKYQERFEEAMANVLNNGDVESNLGVLLEYLDLVTRKAKLPFLHVNNCQELVKLCFSLTANFARL